MQLRFHWNKAGAETKPRLEACLMQLMLQKAKTDMNCLYTRLLQHMLVSEGFIGIKLSCRKEISTICLSYASKLKNPIDSIINNFFCGTLT